MPHLGLRPVKALGPYDGILFASHSFLPTLAELEFVQNLGRRWVQLIIAHLELLPGMRPTSSHLLILSFLLLSTCSLDLRRRYGPSVAEAAKRRSTTLGTRKDHDRIPRSWNGISGGTHRSPASTRLVRRGGWLSLASGSPSAQHDPRRDIELQPIVPDSPPTTSSAHSSEAGSHETDPLVRTASASAAERPETSRDGSRRRRRARRFGRLGRKRFQKWFDPYYPSRGRRTIIGSSSSLSSLSHPTPAPATAQLAALRLQRAERHMRRLQLGLAVGLPLTAAGIGTGFLLSGGLHGDRLKRLESMGVEGIPYKNGTVSWSNGTMQYPNGTMAPDVGPKWVPTGIFDNKKLKGGHNGTAETGQQ